MAAFKVPKFTEASQSAFAPYIVQTILFILLLLFLESKPGAP